MSVDKMTASQQQSKLPVNSAFYHQCNLMNTLFLSELKMKMVSIDSWSKREQLCLASSVLRSGDQNWYLRNNCNYVL